MSCNRASGHFLPRTDRLFSMPAFAEFSSLAVEIAAGSSAFAALIWWVVPAAGLIGGIAYVVWVSKFKRKFESETSRSVGQFQRFQESFRTENPPSASASATEDDAEDQDPDPTENSTR